MFKRIAFLLALIAPGLILLYFTLVPSNDAIANYPLFHFYIVTFTTFSCAVIAVLLGTALIEQAENRHILAAAAFAFIGSMFFSHGFATPGAIIETAHPAIRWSAWLTLFGGGAMFALASLNSQRLPLRFTVNFFIGGLLVYWGIAVFGPNYLDLIETRVAPWHRETIFYASLVLWCFAALRFYLLYRKQPNRVDLTLVAVSLWLAQATISLHRFPVWRLSWWMYHAIMLVSFLITVVVLTIEYERVRNFSLIRYYVAASLIITALLALIASALFTQYSYNNATVQTEDTSKGMAQNIASSIASDFPNLTAADQLNKVTLAEWHNSVIRRLKGLPPTDIIIFDSKGTAVYGSQRNWLGISTKETSKINETLAGKTIATLFSPQSPPDIYKIPDLPVKPTVASGTPIPAATPKPTEEPDDYVGAPKQPRSTPTTSTVSSSTSTADIIALLTVKPPPNAYIIEAYTPLRVNGDAQGAIIGTLVLYQEAQDLNQISLNARTIGLLIASITMSILFFALLVVVNRADKLITTRTNELQTAYGNLRQSESMRDDLTNMIVHDLRNPLNAISATIDLLHMPAINDKVESRNKLLGNAESASRKMTGLIDDLLAVGKIESGELKLNFELTLLAPFLAESTRSFILQAEAENKTITIHCPPDLTAQIDKKLIGRVLDNLINNALKYTESQGKIEIIAQAKGNKTLITVRDDGPGVPDNYKEIIFGKYQQAPNAFDKPQRKGTGLGLAFCRLVVELHGGEIWVSDVAEAKEGSDFNFSLLKN